MCYMIFKHPPFNHTMKEAAIFHHHFHWIEFVQNFHFPRSTRGDQAARARPVAVFPHLISRQLPPTFFSDECTVPKGSTSWCYDRPEGGKITLRKSWTSQFSIFQATKKMCLAPVNALKLLAGLGAPTTLWWINWVVFRDWGRYLKKLKKIIW